MRYNIYSIILASVALLALTGCDKEAGFTIKSGEEGQLNCEALSVDYINRGRNSRAAEVEIGDFLVNFVNTETNEVARSFKYSEMPEIVALPVGNYRAEAEYGDNAIAEWENPYYTGNTTFDIKAGKVTNDVDPIECTLSNIKVTVNVNDLGQDLLGDDIQVVVSAGEDGQLTFDATTNDKAGYFRYVEGSQTLTAEFSGTVDGVEVNQTVAYDDVSEGNSYNLNFEINRPDNMNPGSIKITDTGITLDATIRIEDETKYINPGEPDHEILEDGMRPVEDNSGTGDDPGKDPGNNPGNDPGNDPQPSGNAPEIVTETDGLVVGQPYVIGDGSTCKFKVTSESGITAFTIHIESDTLDADQLDGVGLTADLDLVNPGDYEEGLSGLGFPVADQVLGQHECSFDISEFLGLLAILGPGDHKFHLTVSNANGTTEGVIWLQTK